MSTIERPTTRTVIRRPLTRTVEELRFYDAGRYRGKRITDNDFTAELWQREWTTGTVADPAALRWY